MEKSNKINFGRILRQRRAELNFTQSELADLIGIETSLYQKYEYNICRPNFENTLKIFYYLQISLDKLTEEFMLNNTPKGFNIEGIKRNDKYLNFPKNDFLYSKTKENSKAG